MKRLAVIAAAFLVAAFIVGASVFALGSLKLSAYIVRTGSMLPDYPIGTMVVDSSTVPYQKNHPITFVMDGDIKTHIFRGYREDGSLVTRGLANAKNDVPLRPVYARDVKGTVLFQVKLYSADYRKSFPGIVTIVSLIVLLLDAVAVWWFFVWKSPPPRSNRRSTYRKPQRRNRGAKETDARQPLSAT